MAWRVVEHADRQWHVTVAAERRAPAKQWSLVFSFRSGQPDPRTFWVTYPLTSQSRSALFAQAEQISDEDLTAILVEHLE